MKETIKNEYEQFNKIYKGLNENFEIGMLTNIVGHMAEIKEEEGKNILDFSKLDKSLNEIKEILKGVSIENIKGIKNDDVFERTLKEDLEQKDRMRQECLYSMRTLNWILEDVLKENNEEEK